MECEKSMRISIISLTIVAAQMSAPVLAQDTAPDPIEAFCSVSNAHRSAAGEYQSGLVSDDEARPHRLAFPVTDRDDLAFESNSEDGRYYTYVRSRVTDQGLPYMIHGVFDRETNTLQTANSGVVEVEDGRMVTGAGSYLWQCTRVE